MLTPLLIGSTVINLSSSKPHEYPIQCFLEDVENLVAKQTPFAEEFLPYLEGGIDMLGFFSAKIDEEFYGKFLKLKENFNQFRADNTLKQMLIEDCQELSLFPRLRLAERIAAFEDATSYLEACAGMDLASIGYPERVYIYGASCALNQIHEELCTYLCAVYDNAEWEDYFNFSDLEDQAHNFLLNPTFQSQFQLQLILSLLKSKIHNL